jgi:hypothetical protein
VKETKNKVRKFVFALEHGYNSVVFAKSQQRGGTHHVILECFALRLVRDLPKRDVRTWL